MFIRRTTINDTLRNNSFTEITEILFNTHNRKLVNVYKALTKEQIKEEIANWINSIEEETDSDEWLFDETEYEWLLDDIDNEQPASFHWDIAKLDDYLNVEADIYIDNKGTMTMTIDTWA